MSTPASCKLLIEPIWAPPKRVPFSDGDSAQIGKMNPPMMLMMLAKGPTIISIIGICFAFSRCLGCPRGLGQAFWVSGGPDAGLMGGNPDFRRVLQRCFLTMSFVDVFLHENLMSLLVYDGLTHVSRVC